MKNLSVLIKPASSLCNMKCRYCFYHDISSLREVRSFGIMKDETMREIIDNLLSQVDEGGNLSIAFQGGEPTLAGLPFFEKLIDYVASQEKQVTVNYSLQTNGTMIDEKWCEFLKEHHFLVGLSLDLIKENHDYDRIDNANKGTYSRVVKTKNLFDKFGIEYNILTVLTNQLARYPKRVWDTMNKLDIQYIQFIPCLDDFENEARGLFALSPKRFASFYNELFGYWLRALENGNYRSVKLFDDVVNLLAHGRVTACGMLGKCSMQNVIEADGGTYPCDFYVLDEFKVGNMRTESMKDMIGNPKFQDFINIEKDIGLDECAKCEFYKMCFGNCKRIRNSAYLDEEGNCGYREFLRKNITQLQMIAENERRLAGRS